MGCRGPRGGSLRNAPPSGRPALGYGERSFPSVPLPGRMEKALAKRKKKRRSLIAALFDALLTLIDRLCEGIAAAAVWLLRAAGLLLAALVRGAFCVLGWLARALLSVSGVDLAQADGEAQRRAALPEAGRAGV